MTGTNGHRFSAGVKSRSEGRNVIEPSLLAIAACYRRSRYKTRENASFYPPAEIPLGTGTIDSPTGHTRLFRFWLSYFHRRAIDNAVERYRINGNHFTPTLRLDQSTRPFAFQFQRPISPYRRARGRSPLPRFTCNRSFPNISIAV